MWWNSRKPKEKSTSPRCPTCVTHPIMVQSGYGEKQSLKCPVCKVFFNSKGIRYNPDAPKKKLTRQHEIEDELMHEQEELWEFLWGK